MEEIVSDTAADLRTHGLAADELAVFLHDVAAAEARAQRFIHRALDGVGLGGHVEAVAQHHCGGQDRADGARLLDGVSAKGY